MPTSAAKKALYKKRREAGDCVQCGDPAGGKAKCVLCAQKAADGRSRRREDRKASGQCTECRNPAKSGCTMCQSCIAKSTKGAVDRYYANKAANLCRYCGADAGGKARCRSCAAKLATHQKRNYDEAKAAGLCAQCQASPATSGTVHCDTCRSYHQDKGRRRQQERKTQVFDHYGSTCNGCGCTDPDVLQVDHVNGDGAAHRREIGQSGLYAWLIKHDFPPSFQLLCANCNTKKARNEDNS